MTNIPGLLEPSDLNYNTIKLRSLVFRNTPSGYTTFALQNGGWCASSATAQETFTKYGRSTACKSDGKGGPWGNQVYMMCKFIIVTTLTPTVSKHQLTVSH